MADSAIEYSLSSAMGALGLLSGQERTDAEELIGLCRAHWTAETTKKEADDEHQLLKDAGRLIEVLARRSSTAMP